MNETFMKEADLSSSPRNGNANGPVHAGEFPL